MHMDTELLELGLSACSTEAAGWTRASIPNP